MHTLVISESKPERDLIASYLQPAHRVDLVADKGAAFQILERESPDVVLLNWAQGAPDIIRRIRAYDESRHTYVVAALDKPAAGLITALYQAGADDFLRKPFVKEELVARVETPLRISRWQGAVRNSFDAQEGVDLRKLDTFKNMGHVVGKELGDMVGLLEVTEGWQMAGELRGACIPMSVAAEQAEIRVSVVVEVALIRTLAETLLGDAEAPQEALGDMLREIANTAGGAVKRAAASEKVLVTTGLPNEARGVTRNEFTKCWTARIAGGATQIGIIGEILRHTTQRVPVAKLAEGMVLSHDLRNDAGALVMPAGTRLTATTVARMGQLLGPRFVVDVTTAA